MMLRTLFAFLVYFSICSTADSQHTFSVVAIDTITGQVGGAGATCLSSADCGGCGGAVIINGLVPGKGAMHAQATVCLPNSNLNYGINLMQQDMNAEEILADVRVNDQCGSGGVFDRQYGIVTVDASNTLSADAYTGENALNHAGQRVGVDYAIQGNILLGPEILDSMEARFLRSEGLPLATRLMASLQGANVAGADSRCLNEGVSSRSSFLRVANPDDNLNDLYIDLVVESTPFGVEPIDDLQQLYDDFLISTSYDEYENKQPSFHYSNGYIYLNEINIKGQLLVSDISGRILLREVIDHQTTKIPLETQNLQTVIISFVNQFGDINSSTLVISK